jgi:hypothetical protein
MQYHRAALERLLPACRAIERLDVDKGKQVHHEFILSNVACEPMTTCSAISIPGNIRCHARQGRLTRA